ncbi:MAG: energy transducer TonB [Pyrinomonadaceae bacterium]
MATSRAIHPPAFIFLLSIGLILLLCLQSPSIARSQADERERPPWKTKLYERGVRYQDFACNKEDEEVVAAFFKEHPLQSIFPICHNDCPVIKCRPVIPFPPIAKAAKATGMVSVHVLVNEKGKVLYARVLSGHPLLWAAARNGACETQFKEYPYHMHQGVMHFTVENYEYLGVPTTANQVW